MLMHVGYEMINISEHLLPRVQPRRKRGCRVKYLCFYLHCKLWDFSECFSNCLQSRIGQYTLSNLTGMVDNTRWDLAKGKARSGWIMWCVREMNQQSECADITAGARRIVTIRKTSASLVTVNFTYVSTYRSYTDFFKSKRHTWKLLLQECSIIIVSPNFKPADFV